MDAQQQKKLEELQLIEHNLQQLAVQKQLFQLEIKETLDALEEVKKSKQGDVFKVVGSVMVKANKEQLEKELKEKHELLELRIKSIEKQEEVLKEKALKLREEILKKAK